MSRYIRPIFKTLDCLDRRMVSYRPLPASILNRHSLNRPMVLSFSTSVTQQSDVLQQSSASPTEAQKQLDQKLRERIESIIKSDTLVLFMKARQPSRPVASRCAPLASFRCMVSRSPRSTSSKKRSFDPVRLI